MAGNTLPRQTVPDFTGFGSSCRDHIPLLQVSRAFAGVQALVQVRVGNTTAQDIKLRWERATTPPLLGPPRPPQGH
jgi:hypothetical protein